MHSLRGFRSYAALDTGIVRAALGGVNVEISRVHSTNIANRKRFLPGIEIFLYQLETARTAKTMRAEAKPCPNAKAPNLAFGFA